MRPGDRRGHPHLGRGDAVIGPYLLACLDMAGTTVRDDGAVEAAFAAALAAVGIEAQSERRAEARSWYARPWAGRRPTSSPGCSSPPPPPRRRPRSRRAYETQVASGGAAEIPGALDVMRELRRRGVAVCLTTGFAPSTRNALLGALGWQGDVDLALSPADVGRGRPAPDMILGAMARLRVGDSAAVVVVGDTASDLEAGARADAGAIVGVLSGAHDEATLHAAPHTAIITDVTELVPVLEARADRITPPDQRFSTETETCSIIVQSEAGCAPREDVTHGRCGAHAPGDGAGRHRP